MPGGVCVCVCHAAVLSVQRQKISAPVSLMAARSSSGFNDEGAYLIIHMQIDIGGQRSEQISS